MKNTIGTFVGI